jgi:hypothetical protein
MTNPNRLVKNIIQIGLVLCILISIILYSSCESVQNYYLCNPKPAYQIEIIDKDSVNIFGFDKKYNPDSIYYEINSEKSKAITNSQYIYLPVGFNILKDKEFYLILNNSDKDTLRLTIENGTNECGKYTNILEFYHNNKLVKEKSRVFKIAK